MAKQEQKQAQEQTNVVVNQYGDEIEKDEIVWENVNGQLMFDSGGNPMDASRKERFYGRAAGQEEVRQIFFTSDIEEATHEDRIRQQVHEATRDTMSESYDPRTISYAYQVTGPDVKIDPAEVGAELPEIFDSQTSAKITMFENELKDVNEPGVDPEELGEEFERQFREAGRDPWIEPRREMSEEYKQEKGYSKERTRSPTWSVIPLFSLSFVDMVESVFHMLISLLSLSVWIIIFGAVAYLLARRYFPDIVPDLQSLRRLGVPRRLRLLLPDEVQQSPRRFVGLGVFIAGLVLILSGSPILGTLFIIGLFGYVSILEIKSLLAKRTWVNIAEDGAYPVEFRIDNVSDEFDGQVLSDVISLNPEGSIGLIGAARSGKTQAMYLIAYQMVQESRHLDNHLSTTFVTYDRKDDWKEFLPTSQTVRIAGEDPTHVWNLFREVESESDFDVMARLIFPEAHESGGNDFFPKAARQVFAGACKYLWREFNSQDAGIPSNADLVSFFRRTREEMHDDLSEYDDLTAATSAIDPDAEGQAAGVFASVQQEIKDTFVETFGKSPEEVGKPAFSFREYYEEPNNRYVLIDHQQRLGDAVDNIFRYFIDRSTRLGLDSNTQMSYFILDEFARIPHLRNIGELVSVGPGQNCNAMVALQSKTQLSHNYGSEQANSILAGLLTQIILRLNDDESIEHAKSMTGVRHVSSSPNNSFRPFEEVEDEPQREQNDFAGGEFLSFSDGECVIKRKDGWARGYLPMLRAQKWKIDAAHGWDDSKKDDNDQAVESGPEPPKSLSSEVSMDD